MQEQTLRLMRALGDELGAAVLIITHNLGVVREFAQRVYVMYAGSIVEEADVDTLFRAPRHPYTRALLEAVPRLTGEMLPRPIEGVVPDYTAAPVGCRFHPRCAHAQAICREPPPVADLGGGPPGRLRGCQRWSHERGTGAQRARAVQALPGQGDPHRRARRHRPRRLAR